MLPKIDIFTVVYKQNRADNWQFTNDMTDFYQDGNEWRIPAAKRNWRVFPVTCSYEHALEELEKQRNKYGSLPTSIGAIPIFEIGIVNAENGMLVDVIKV